MAIVDVEDSAPLLLKPYVSGGAILLKAYDKSKQEDADVPAGDSVRDKYRPPEGIHDVETQVEDDGATAFAVSDAAGPWTRPPGKNYSFKQLAVPPTDNTEYTYPITIAVPGGPTRNQTVIIRRKPF